MANHISFFLPQAGEAGVFAALFGILMAFMLAMGLVVYIYTAIVLMTLAKKTNTKPAWLAWIPIANLYLTTKIAKVQWWTFFAFLLFLVPAIGWMGFTAVMIWWWWNIAERMKFPGWISLLLLVPVVNLIIMGIIAWANPSAPSKKKKK